MTITGIEIFCVKVDVDPSRWRRYLFREPLSRPVMGVSLLSDGRVWGSIQTRTHSDGGK